MNNQNTMKHLGWIKFHFIILCTGAELSEHLKQGKPNILYLQSNPESNH